MGSDTLPVLYGSLGYGREDPSRFHYSTCGHALMPPSTVRFAPLMYDDSGPATNATSAATSSGCPYRSSGAAAFWPTAHSPEAGFRSVSIGPGWTLLTVTPRAPSSRASPCVNILMAPLVAE